MGHKSSLDSFLNLHRSQLSSSGIPETYWRTLHRKLVDETFDGGTTFRLLRFEYDEEEKLEYQPVWALEATREIDRLEEKEIYLIDHAWTFRVPQARSYLMGYPNLRNRMCNILGIDDSLECSKKIEEILKQMWKVSNTYSITNSPNVEDRLPVWYVMDEIGSAVFHDDNPNCRIVPFYFHGDQVTYSVLFPIKDIEQGDLLTRDFAEGISDPVVRAATLIPWQPHSFENVSIVAPMPNADYYLKGHIEETLPDLEDLAKFNPIKKDKFKVFTEYELVKEYLTDESFEIVECEQEADILWYTHHFKDYLTLSQSPSRFVNQFPFEFVITIKDLLWVTSRRSEEHPFPSWMPVTYNLVTEIPNFISYYEQRQEKKLDNHWIIKPYNLARGLDMHITDILNYIVRLPATGPKIAQKYIENPVLFHRPEINAHVKFDIRYVILLTNVNPLKAFAYTNFFLRFANKSFEMKDFDDYEKHYTVMNYTEDATLKHMLCSEFKAQWMQQYPTVSWSEVEKLIFAMLKKILTSAVKEKPPCGIAESPQSRALYAVDLMLEWSNDTMQPKLLEINWTPDCKRACEYYPDFYNKIFRLLFRNDECDEFYEL